MCLRFSKVGRITGAQDTHSQDRAYIRFGTEELQCLTKTNLVILRISPLYFRVKPRLCQHAVSAMGRHVAGGGIASTWGKFTEFYWFYGSFLLAKKKSFLTESTLNRLDIWKPANRRCITCRHFSHSKNKFLRRSNDLKYVCGSLARCMEKCVVHFFLLLIR